MLKKRIEKPTVKEDRPTPVIDLVIRYDGRTGQVGLTVIGGSMDFEAAYRLLEAARAVVQQWDRSAGELALGYDTTKVIRFYAGNAEIAGTLKAGGGNVILSSAGLSLNMGTNYSNQIQWIAGSNIAAYLGIYNGSLHTTGGLFTFPTGSDTGSIAKLEAKNNAAGVVSISAYAYSTDLWVSIDGGYLNVLDGIHVGGAGTDPGQSNIGYEGKLRSYKNSTFYDVYGTVPLATPLTSTSWDGDAKSTTAKTSLYLPDIFSTPIGVRGVFVTVRVRDSGSATNDTYMLLAPNNTAGSGIRFSCKGAPNDEWVDRTAFIPCGPTGNYIYYQIAASGASTFDVVIEIWGYLI